MKWVELATVLLLFFSELLQDSLIAGSVWVYLFLSTFVVGQ